MNLNIKQIPKKDLDLADKIQQEILNPNKKKRYRTFGFIKKNYEKAPSLFLGAYIKEKLIGIIFGYKIKKKILIGEFAVLEKYRNKSVGKKLLDNFEKNAKKLNQNYIEVGAFENAERFYIKNNYTPIAFAQIYHKNVPKNYNEIGLKIIKETNYKDAKRLWIKIEYNNKNKKYIKEKLNAYNVIYLFIKNI
jgi:GNAT superfamily N-acetyltransferase